MMADDNAIRFDSGSRRKFLTASAGVGAIALAGCTQQGGSEPADDGDSGSADDGSSEPETLSGEINIAGSSTVFPVATALAEIFQQQNPDVNINIQSTGSGGGFANFFCPGETDFNNASRPIKDSEREECLSNGVNPLELVVATDALTVVVNEDNPVDSVTVDELQQIWSGDTQPTNWNDVNSDWPDLEFEMYGPTEASGTYDYFNEAIMDDGEVPHRQDYSATEQDRTIIQGVEGSTAGIGYMGFSYYINNADRVKALAIDGGAGPVEPSLATAKSGEYTPLARPLFTYPSVDALAKPQVREFARFFVDNTDNQEVIADDVGYVPLDAQTKEEMVFKLEGAISTVV
ncbi:MAG: PstS family phosphate ABC transporter substrate-binding protein [Haloferacaceae archaeon]|nr:PstS family phosphate ABC transporter substrate-binding protein [Haloferacaceae archaeon]